MQCDKTDSKKEVPLAGFAFATFSTNRNILKISKGQRRKSKAFLLFRYFAKHTSCLYCEAKKKNLLTYSYTYRLGPKVLQKAEQRVFLNVLSP